MPPEDHWEPLLNLVICPTPIKETLEGLSKGYYGLSKPAAFRKLSHHYPSNSSGNRSGRGQPSASWHRKHTILSIACFTSFVYLGGRFSWVKTADLGPGKCSNQSFACVFTPEWPFFRKVSPLLGYFASKSWASGVERTACSLSMTSAPHGAGKEYRHHLWFQTV